MSGMDWREQNEIVEGILGDLRKGTGGWWRGNCPLCVYSSGSEDKRFSFGLNASSGYYHCFRCNSSGRYKNAHEFFGVPQEQDEPEQVTLAEIAPPSKCYPLWAEPAASAVTLTDAREYLLGRGFTPDLWKRADIHACGSGWYTGPTKTQRVVRRIVVPIKAPDGRWLGWSARDWSGTAVRKYLYPEGMNRGTLFYNAAVLTVETDEPALIVEGVFDALPHFDVAAACLGKPSQWQRAMLTSVRRPIAVVLDGDAWEEGQALAWHLQLNGVRAGFVKLDPKEDPGVVDTAWLREEARRCIT